MNKENSNTSLDKISLCQNSVKIEAVQKSVIDYHYEYLAAQQNLIKPSSLALESDTIISLTPGYSKKNDYSSNKNIIPERISQITLTSGYSYSENRSSITSKKQSNSLFSSEIVAQDEILTVNAIPIKECDLLLTENYLYGTQQFDQLDGSLGSKNSNGTSNKYTVLTQLQDSNSNATISQVHSETLTEERVAKLCSGMKERNPDPELLECLQRLRQKQAHNALVKVVEELIKLQVKINDLRGVNIGLKEDTKMLKHELREKTLLMAKVFSQQQKDATELASEYGIMWRKLNGFKEHTKNIGIKVNQLEQSLDTVTVTADKRQVEVAELKIALKEKNKSLFNAFAKLSNEEHDCQRLTQELSLLKAETTEMQTSLLEEFETRLIEVREYHQQTLEKKNQEIANLNEKLKNIKNTSHNFSASSDNIKSEVRETNNKNYNQQHNILENLEKKLNSSLEKIKYLEEDRNILKEENLRLSSDNLSNAAMIVELQNKTKSNLARLTSKEQEAEKMRAIQRDLHERLKLATQQKLDITDELDILKQEQIELSKENEEKSKKIDEINSHLQNSQFEITANKEKINNLELSSYNNELQISELLIEIDLQKAELKEKETEYTNIVDQLEKAKTTILQFEYDALIAQDNAQQQLAEVQVLEKSIANANKIENKKILEDNLLLNETIEALEISLAESAYRYELEKTNSSAEIAKLEQLSNKLKKEKDLLFKEKKELQKISDDQRCKFERLEAEHLREEQRYEAQLNSNKTQETSLREENKNLIESLAQSETNAAKAQAALKRITVELSNTETKLEEYLKDRQDLQKKKFQIEKELEDMAELHKNEMLDIELSAQEAKTKTELAVRQFEELNVLIKSKEELLTTLTEEKHKNLKEIKTLQNDKRVLELKLAGLESLYANSEARKTEFANKLDSLRKQNTDTELENTKLSQALKKNISTVNSQFEAISRAKEKNDNNKLTYEAKIKSLQHDIENLKNDLTSASTKNKKYIEELEELKNNYEVKSYCMEQLEREIKQTTDSHNFDFTELKSNYEKNLLSLSEINNKLDLHIRERDELHIKLSLEKEYSEELNNKIKTLEQELNSYKDDSNAKIDIISNEKSVLLKQIEELKSNQIELQSVLELKTKVAKEIETEKNTMEKELKVKEQNYLTQLNKIKVENSYCESYLSIVDRLEMLEMNRKPPIHAILSNDWSAVV